MQLHQKQIESDDVKVKILLTGGHEYTIWLKTYAPLLRSLLEAITGRSEQQTTTLDQWFHIPIEEGRAALTFAKSSLVGVMTEPPLLLEQKSQLHFQPAADVLVSPYVQLDNFLTQEEKAQLLAYAMQKESAFVPTGPATNTSYHPDHRNSWVLFHFPEFYEFFISRLKSVIPHVISKLGMPLFPISRIEAQLTAHNDNNYYKIHNDNGTPETATRELTYAYYFYKEPKPFVGGELVIYDSDSENSKYYKAESFKKIEPHNNSIVFFPSRCCHEVLPVNCLSKAFADSRFTINGWVRR